VPRIVLPLLSVVLLLPNESVVVRDLLPSLSRHMVVPNESVEQRVVSASAIEEVQTSASAAITLSISNLL